MTTQYDINWLTQKFENGNALEYIFFWGHTNKSKEQVNNTCFSQWFPSPFTVDNVFYKTAEHWMMAHKALLFDNSDIFEKIINSDNPKDVKELGRNVIGYDDQKWNENKFEIVKLGNIHKFNQHPKLAEYLLDTEEKIIVEASPVDKVWGIGLSQDSKEIDNIYAWGGQNLLGFALMEVRDFLKEFGHFKPLDNAIQTPWTKFPNVDRSDMFWRMGLGEEYMDIFDKYYHNLTNKDKQSFRLTNPEPYNWANFYH